MAHIIDNVTCEGLVDTLAFRTQATVQATAASTFTCLTTTPFCVIFTGTTAGQIVALQNATTINIGYQQNIHNNSTQNIDVRDAGGTTLITLTPTQRIIAILQVAGTTAGTWSLEFVTSSAEAVQYKTLMQGLEDFGYIDGNLDIGHSDLGLVRGASGTSATASILAAPLDALSCGILQFTTGTTSTGRCFVSAINSGFTFRLSTLIFRTEFRVMIPTLSTATQRFTAYFGGFLDGTSAGQPTNGLYFIYSDNINAGDWSLRSVSASTASTLDTNVVCTAGSWIRLRFDYISSSLVECYVNDALVGTIVSNIPTNTELFPCFKLEKSVGTTARLAYMDSVWWRMDR